MMRIRVALVALLLSTPASAQRVSLAEADLLRAALSRNPVESLRAAVAAREELARVARVTAPAMSLVGRRESVSGALDADANVIGVGVSFDLSRANALAREAAGRDAAAAAASRDELLLDVACEVRSLAAAVVALERRQRTLDDERARITTLRVEAERRAAAGEDAPFEADVLRAEEAAREMLVPALRAAEASARAALGAITGLDVDSLTLEEGQPVPASDALAAAVVTGHPRLKSTRARLDAARSRTEAARATGAARLELFGGARGESEPGLSGDGYEVEVGVTLPQRSLRRSAVAEATAFERDAESDVALAERDVRRRLASALAAWTDLDTQARRVRTEPARPLVEGSMRRYRAGEGSLAEVIQVLALERERVLAEAELQSALRAARLELDCASGLLTAPDLLLVLEEARP